VTTLTSKPIFSIIVAVFNGAETLQQCIDSVAQQTYPNKELIIIDGNSTDETTDIVKANQEKISYWISEPDQGIYHAWNKGLTKVKGDWICFLGADDYLWNQLVLEKMAEQLQTLSTHIRVAYGRIMIIDSEGNNLYTLGAPWNSIKERFKNFMCIPHPGSMHRRNLFDQHGPFDESFRIAADYEFLLRELPKGDAFFMPDIIVAGMRQGGVSSASVNLLLAYDEIRRAQRMHEHVTPWLLRFTGFISVNIRLFLIKIFGEAKVRKIINQSKKIIFSRN
jgi:glycosyltransferase involved in cell wall biosynthesis